MLWLYIFYFLTTRIIQIPHEKTIAITAPPPGTASRPDGHHQNKGTANDGLKDTDCYQTERRPDRLPPVPLEQVPAEIPVHQNIVAGENTSGESEGTGEPYFEETTAVES